jgi:hypothetical protein
LRPADNKPKEIMKLPQVTEPETGPIFRSFEIDGKRFQVTLSEEGKDAWRWCIIAPGEISLSGEAPSEMQALHLAGRAGRALARARRRVIPRQA